MKKLLVFLSLAMMINIQTAHGDSATSTTQVQSADAATQTEDTIYTKNDMLECSICTKALTRKDRITKTPCGHTFCQICLQRHKEAQQAINVNPLCPNCSALLIERPRNNFLVLMTIGATYFLTTNNTTYTDVAKKSSALLCTCVLAHRVNCIIKDRQRDEEEISMLENLISKGANNIVGAAIVGLCQGAIVGSIKATSRLCGSFLFND